MLRYPDPDVAPRAAQATLGMIGGQYLDVTTDGGVDERGAPRAPRAEDGKAARGVGGDGDWRWRGSRAPTRAPGARSEESSASCSRSWTTSSTPPGRPSELGKTPGKDEAAGKVTYVSLHGLERARALADEARGRVEDAPGALPGDTAVLAELVSAIRERRA